MSLLLKVLQTFSQYYIIGIFRQLFPLAIMFISLFHLFFLFNFFFAPFFVHFFCDKFIKYHRFVHGVLLIHILRHFIYLIHSFVNQRLHYRPEIIPLLIFLYFWRRSCFCFHTEHRSHFLAYTSWVRFRFRQWPRFHCAIIVNEKAWLH